MFTFKARRRLLLGSVATLALLPGTLVHADDNPQPIGDLPGTDYSIARAISADGNTVVGTAFANDHSTAYLRTSDGSRTVLADGYDGDSQANAVNSDGTIVVGFATNADTGNNYDAILVNVATGEWRWLGTLGGASSFARSVSSDGSVVVGSSDMSDGNSHAFRWTESSGMVDLGTLNGDSFSDARAVSADGKTAVGSSGYDSGMFQTRGAVRWVGTGQAQGLGLLDGGTTSEATGVNGDGSIIVGTADDSSGMTQAFRWSAASGKMESLGFLSGGVYSAANAISVDGRVIVGYAEDSQSSARGFVWTEAGKMQSLDSLLQAEGVNLGGLHIINAKSVNRDGSVILTTGDDDRNYIARISTLASPATTDPSTNTPPATSDGGTNTPPATSDPGTNTPPASTDGGSTGPSDSGGMDIPPATTDGGTNTPPATTNTPPATNPATNTPPATSMSGASSGNGMPAGLMDVAEFQTSLSNTAPVFGFAAKTTGLLLNGAHGKPMRSVLGDGENAIWAGGDLASLLSNDASGFSGLGEIGFGHGFGGGISAEVSIGGFGEETSFATGGRAGGRMLFVVPEFGFELRDDLRMTLTGFYGRGTLDTRRGYLNGASTDYSEGASDVASVAGRMRLDWVDAYHADKTAITPFVSYMVSRSDQSAYTETGGAFPVAWDAYSDTTHVVRTGLDSVTDLDQQTKLLGHLEASYGSNGSAPVTGRIIGISNFDLGSADHGGFGAQAGIGAEYDTGHGIASLMINGAIGANNPVAWAAASYRVKF